MDELIQPERSPQNPDWRLPIRGFSFWHVDWRCVVSFDGPEDRWWTLHGGPEGTLPPGLCDEVRGSLEQIAAGPLWAQIDQASPGGDTLTVYLGAEEIVWGANRGYFLDAPIVRSRAAVARLVCMFTTVT